MKLTYAAPLLILAASQGASAQSSVSISGILDGAVRYTTNENAARGSLTQVIGGGMSQSTLTFGVQEDLGGGMKAFGLLDAKLNADSGTVAASTVSLLSSGGYWDLSYVGLQSASLGSLTVGRQWNLLFDVVTFTPYASFRTSPYINAYKPEMAFAFGARQDNLVKYAISSGGLLAELAASPGEGNALGGKSYGGMLRYNTGAVGVGGGYEDLQDGTGKKADAYTVGIGYTSANWLLNAGWVRNKFEAGFNPALINLYLGGTSIYGQASNIEYRDLFQTGLTYNFSSALSLSAEYWRGEQKGRIAATDGSADFMSTVLDYAFSKRTDVYAELDHTNFHGGLTYPNGAQTRNGAMVGLRARF